MIGRRIPSKAIFINDFFYKALLLWYYLCKAVGPSCLWAQTIFFWVKRIIIMTYSHRLSNLEERRQFLTSILSLRLSWWTCLCLTKWQAVMLIVQHHCCSRFVDQTFSQSLSCCLFSWASWDRFLKALLHCISLCAQQDFVSHGHIQEYDRNRPRTFRREHSSLEWEYGVCESRTCRGEN